METIRQLNPFEIKATISNIITQFANSNQSENYIESIKLLDAQNDKKTIVKLLYKELYNLKSEENSVLCFLLERFADKDELTKKLWDIIKNDLATSKLKIFAINFLRGLNTQWELDSSDELLNAQIIDEDTKKLLNNAIVNPEVQIDFLDFLTSLSTNDKITLIESLAQDYSNNELANILIPVFLSQPDSVEGKTSLKLLGESKSQLAFHALNSSLDSINDNLIPLVKKSISTLKIAGIREDNTENFYKQILASTKPYKCCATYPDGHGNQALIFTRRNDEGRIQFVATVINDYNGIRDCFGFYDISQFECDKIIERFYSEEQELLIDPVKLVSILTYAEKISQKKCSSWLIPYEYVCWKNLMRDIGKEDIKEYLNYKYTFKKLDDNSFNKILDMDFMDKWFLDSKYSDEFEEMLAITDNNINTIVSKNINKVFYNEEKYIWKERLLMVCYLKDALNYKSEASLLYSLYNDEKYSEQFYESILKRSIYQYYINLKYDTEANNGRYTIEEINDIIKEIEAQWVCTK